MKSKVIHIETQYLGIMKILALMIGLWPYQRSKLVRFQFVLSTVILSTFVISQLATFLTLECTPELIIGVCSFTSLFINFEIAHYIFWSKGNTIKYLLEQLQRICNELNDDYEVTIIEECGNSAKRFATGIVITATSVLSVILCLEFGPLIINVILSVNETKARRLPIMTEYFLDKEKYFYLIMLHMNLAIIMGTVAAMSVGLILKTYLQFMCGMFRIASYRIEQALSYNIVRNITKAECSSYNQIICAVDIHCKAMKFSQFCMSTFDGFFFLVLTSIVICMSLNFFCILQLFSTKLEFDQLSFHMGPIIICLIILFFANYTGQEIIDCNNQIFDTAYNIKWYESPLDIQKLILLILQRSNKAFLLHVGGFYIIRLENFATLTSSAISYCTAMNSVQR